MNPALPMENRKKKAKAVLLYLALTLLSVLLFNCQSNQDESKNMQSSTTKEVFGKLKNGQQADLYTLTNANGMVVKITNYGGIITHWLAPDKDGTMADVVLGFDSLDSYVANNPFFGALVGRYGNRIAKGTFTLDGQTYPLVTNNGPNHLHGGTKGFDKVLWNVQESPAADGESLVLTYTSKDMEEGYPGNLDVKVTYTLTNDNKLKIEYAATTDKPTIVNLTNHSYFNLTGMKRDILDHEISIKADSLVEVDGTLIPTGKLISVEGTPFDFRKMRPIGEQIDDISDEQIKNGGGYDHCWVVQRADDSLLKIATVVEPTSGRMLDVYTTEPGVQFYTGNFLNGKTSGKGVTYTKRMGFCLETEHYPDSPNQTKFPSVVLRPGEQYHTTTVYQMSVKK
jgi:aldose 1-epimerase